MTKNLNVSPGAKRYLTLMTLAITFLISGSARAGSFCFQQGASDFKVSFYLTEGWQFPWAFASTKGTDGLCLDDDYLNPPLDHFYALVANLGPNKFTSPAGANIDFGSHGWYVMQLSADGRSLSWVWSREYMYMFSQSGVAYLGQIVVFDKDADRPNPTGKGTIAALSATEPQLNFNYVNGSIRGGTYRAGSIKLLYDWVPSGYSPHVIFSAAMKLDGKLVEFLEPGKYVIDAVDLNGQTDPGPVSITLRAVK